jgi:hypothetical protein
MSACLDLQTLRAEYLQTLTRTCTVPGLPRTVAVNDETTGVGGTTQTTLATPTTGVPCAFSVVGGSTPAVEGAQLEIGTVVMRFGWNVALRSGMTIVVDAGPNGEPSRTFQLVAQMSTSLLIGQRWTAIEYGQEV